MTLSHGCIRLLVFLVLLPPNGPKHYYSPKHYYLPLTSLQAYKYRCLWFCPFKWLCHCCARCQYRLRVAAGRLDSAAICPQSAAVMLNSVKLSYFPLLLHSLSNKPKLPGIKSNSTVCKHSFGYYCWATICCSGR